MTRDEQSLADILLGLLSIREYSYCLDFDNVRFCLLKGRVNLSLFLIYSLPFGLISSPCLLIYEKNYIYIE